MLGSFERLLLHVDVIVVVFDQSGRHIVQSLIQFDELQLFLLAFLRLAQNLGQFITGLGVALGQEIIASL